MKQMREAAVKLDVRLEREEEEPIKISLLHNCLSGSNVEEVFGTRFDERSIQKNISSNAHHIAFWYGSVKSTHLLIFSKIDTPIGSACLTLWSLERLIALASNFTSNA